MVLRSVELVRCLGVARVEALLEVAADALAAREHGLVPHTTGRELHEPHVLVAVAVTASVCGGLIQGPKAVALPLSPHVLGHLSEGHAEGNPRAVRRVALCDENDECLAGQKPASHPRYVAYPGLQLQGLQSRPDRTKYSCAASA